MLTPQQKQQLDVWAQQRDEAIRQLSAVNTELEEAKKNAKSEALYLDTLRKDIAEAKGRIAEIYAHEDRLKTSTSEEIVKLRVEKSEVEGQIEAKKAELIGIEDRKNDILNFIDSLVALHERSFARILSMDEEIGKNKEEMLRIIVQTKEFMQMVKQSAEDLIEVNKSNVKDIKIVSENLPRYIFELQKPIPIRQGEKLKKIDPASISIKEK